MSGFATRRPFVISGIAAFAVLSAIAFAANYSNDVSISESGDRRNIDSNGIPDHPFGDFPNRNNPNRVLPQSHHFEIALHPEPSEDPTPVGMNAFGVALNGVPFDPAAAEWYDRDPNSGWRYEALGGSVDLGMDANNAHVQPGGVYHYHGIPTGILDDGRTMQLVGYAADGFPIYALYGFEDPTDPNSQVIELTASYRIRDGVRPDGPGGTYDGTFVEDWEFVAGLGDLDECNGRSGVTPEYPDGTYYYVLTDEFPYVPRMWRGVPDTSFFKPAGPPPGMRPPPGHRPPPGIGPPPR